MGYENVIIEGMIKLNNKSGVTVQSIIKYMKDQHEMKNSHAFKKALNNLKKNDKVKVGKNKFYVKLNYNPNEEKEKKQKERKKAADKKKKDADKKKAADKKK